MGLWTTSTGVVHVTLLRGETGKNTSTQRLNRARTILHHAHGKTSPPTKTNVRELHDFITGHPCFVYVQPRPRVLTLMQTIMIKRTLL